MIQTNSQSNTISGYFGLTIERKDAIEKQFEELREKQKDIVLKHILKSVDDSGLDNIGFDRVPIIDAYMSIAKNENEQLFCIFRIADELDFFKTLMDEAVAATVLKLFLNK